MTEHVPYMQSIAFMCRQYHVLCRGRLSSVKLKRNWTEIWGMSMQRYSNTSVHPLAGTGLDAQEPADRLCGLLDILISLIM